MDKHKIAAKIQALRNKTVENGASEEEALAAATKAHELHIKYQIEFGSVELRAQGVVQKDTPKATTLSGIKLSSHKFGIKWFLTGHVATYCDCEAWGYDDDIRVLGLPSDVDFFMWLIDSLGLFVVLQMEKHMATLKLRDSAQRWHARKAFVFGCTYRIGQKLEEAKPQEMQEQAQSSEGRELMVVKNQLVKEAYDKLGLKLKFGRSKSYRNYGDSYGAGYKAGGDASIGRPINGNGDVRRLR